MFRLPTIIYILVSSRHRGRDGHPLSKIPICTLMKQAEIRISKHTPGGVSHDQIKSTYLSRLVRLIYPEHCHRKRWLINIGMTLHTVLYRSSMVQCLSASCWLFVCHLMLVSWHACFDFETGSICGLSITVKWFKSGVHFDRLGVMEILVSREFEGEEL
jgi:hypothetical protein